MAKRAERTVDVVLNIPVPDGMMFYTIKDEENDRYEINVVPIDAELSRNLCLKGNYPTFGRDDMRLNTSIGLTVSVSTDKIGDKP